jgi:hypothetical protein
VGFTPSGDDEGRNIRRAEVSLLVVRGNEKQERTLPQLLSLFLDLLLFDTPDNDSDSDTLDDKK